MNTNAIRPAGTANTPASLCTYATITPPPTTAAKPITAKPTRRSETPCANEFHIACSNAEKRTANTIDNVTQLAPPPKNHALHIHSPQMHADADVQSPTMTESDPDEATGQGKPGNTAEPEPETEPEPTPESAPKSEPTRRSNEFYLALAGIAATVVLGLVGALLTAQASTRQIAAESDRAAVNFSREQRKNAYADFLNALFDLDRAEFNIHNDIHNDYDTSPSDAPNPTALEDQYKAYTDATDELNRTVSAVRLLASPEVAAAREAIRQDHSAIYKQIDVLMAAARSGAAANDIRALRERVDVGAPDLEERFIQAAKKDLGITE